jgi:hypothetical protein
LSIDVYQRCSELSQDQIDTLGASVASQAEIDSGNVHYEGCSESKQEDGESSTEITFTVAVTDQSRTPEIIAALTAILTSATFEDAGVTLIEVTTTPTLDVYIVVDCNGSPYNGVVIDLCGVCGGENTCFDCTGYKGGELVEDACGVCGGITESSEDCIVVGSEQCADNEEFVDEQGMTCNDWMSYSCITATRDYGMSVQGVKDLLANCPYTCRQCVGSCVDSEDFKDESGLSCSAWMGYDCTSAESQWSYSHIGQAALVENCKYSCQLCDAVEVPTPAPTAVPTTETEEDEDEDDSESGMSTVAIGAGVGAAAAALVFGVAFMVMHKKNSESRTKVHNAKVVHYAGETTL